MWCLLAAHAERSKRLTYFLEPTFKWQGVGLQDMRKTYIAK